MRSSYFHIRPWRLQRKVWGWKNFHNSRQQETVPWSTNKLNFFFAYRHKDFDLSHFLLNVPVDVPIILREEYPVKSTESWVPMLFWTELRIVLTGGEHFLVSPGISARCFNLRRPCFQRANKSTWITLSTPFIKPDGQPKQTNSQTCTEHHNSPILPLSSFSFSFSTVPRNFWNYSKKANTDCCKILFSFLRVLCSGAL